MENKIQVFKVGTEGGGASVFRTLLGPGSWQFHVEGSSMTEDNGRAASLARERDADRARTGSSALAEQEIARYEG